MDNIIDKNEHTLLVSHSKLYCDGKLVGTSQEQPGFSQFIFDEEPLGSGANGITFSVTHKILNVKQVVKIYFPKSNETSVAEKAKEEAKKNANTELAGVIAVVFDAGEYEYPCKLWYSVMESVSSYCTFKQWRTLRNVYFTSNNHKFDIEDINCQCSIHTSINLAAGLLKAIIILYDNNVIHGDLNPGNVLWIFKEGTINKNLKDLSSYQYHVLGEMEPFCVRLIDMGSSKLCELENGGQIRDAWKIYDHMRSLLSPMFTKSNYKFTDWFNFHLLETSETELLEVDKIVGFESEEGIDIIAPQELTGDFFRLICVLTLALGIITNTPMKEEKSIILDEMDIGDFSALMYGNYFDDAIKAFSYDSMSILQKLKRLSSCGNLINWENVWTSYPLCRIDISPVLNLL